MGLDLVEDRLDLPALRVGGGEILGGGEVGVEDGGDQAVDLAGLVRIRRLAGLQRVLDDAHGDPLAASAGAGRGQVGQVGALGQFGDHGQPGVGFGPPQQVRPGRGGGGPQLVAQEVAVGQHQHPRTDLAQQPRGTGPVPRW